VSPHSKQNLAWEDKDTLLIGRDWGPGTMTKSGYPFVVKEWKRGTPLDSAQEIFRGEPDDIFATGFVLHDAQGEQLSLFLRRVTFFESRYWVKTPQGLKELALPRKADPAGLLAGRFLVQLHEDWTPNPGGPTFNQGSLVSLSLPDLLRDPAHLKPTTVFAPTADEFLSDSATTRTQLIVTTLEHVLGRAYVYSPAGKDGWAKKVLDVPENSTVQIATASDTTDQFFLRTAGFLTPPALLAGDASTGQLTPSRSQPPLFDASQNTVE